MPARVDQHEWLEIFALHLRRISRLTLMTSNQPCGVLLEICLDEPTSCIVYMFAPKYTVPACLKP